MQDIVNYFRSLDTTNIITLGITALIGLSTFIEIAPIKINPWSSLLEWIGNKLMRDTKEQIEKMDKKIEAVNDRFDKFKNDIDRRLEDMSERDDIDQMDYIRWEILDFANSCRHDRKHTKDEFDHVIAQNKKYEGLLEKTGRDNGVYEEEYKYILKLYHKCLEENDFL